MYSHLEEPYGVRFQKQTLSIYFYQFSKKKIIQFHGLSHPGTRPTVKQITAEFIWPGINKQVRECAQMCVNYLKAKVTAMIDLFG